jgi:hypothetical protein
MTTATGPTTATPTTAGAWSSNYWRSGEFLYLQFNNPHNPTVLISIYLSLSLRNISLNEANKRLVRSNETSQQEVSTTKALLTAEKAVNLGLM